MAKTISGSYSTGFTLSNPNDNPVSVTGTISLASAGIDLQAASAWSVFNSGSIIGPNVTSSYGVSLGAGGYVDNQSGGIIKSYFGIDISSSTGTVVNAGGISAGGTATIASGVYFRQGGSVSNAAGAAIAGDQTGIRIAGAAGTVTNSGSIAGTAYDGIYMLAGGSVTNAASATITGGYVGVVTSLGSGGTVLNAGYIAGSTKDGVVLQHGGSVSNAASGLIKGLGDEGVFLYNGGTFTNAGTVIGFNGGADILRGASVTNQSGGTIESNRYGVFMRYAFETAVNAGLISGNTVAGIMLYSGGAVTNQAGGTVRSDSYTGIWALSTSSTVLNEGSISASSYGVRLAAGGVVLNQASASISGAIGIGLNGGGTVTNAGTITGAGGKAVTLGSGSNELLVVDPGAVFSGLVDGGNTIHATSTSTLELAAGAGTFGGAGASFTNFGSIEFDTGAAWKLIGASAVLAGGQTISGFAKGATIEITGVTDSIDSYSAGTLTLTGSMPLTLLLPGTFSSGDFLASNSGGNTDIIIACFAAGTRILTEYGEVEVERLRPGVRVVSLTHHRLLPVRWIGSQRIDCRTQGQPAHTRPVRITAGAFGPGMPARDLLLSPDHAVFVEGALIPVRYLINGASVAQIECDAISYFHVELAGHGVLVADGLPAESYLDTNNRTAFTAMQMTGRDPASQGRRGSVG
jgi:hypothetical protein